MLQVSGLRKSYGSQIIFDDAGFTINSGERVGLVGRNGHGKTTLFRMILGMEQPDSGIISVPNDYSTGHLSQHLSFAGDTVLKEACRGMSRAEDGRDESYRAETVLMGLGFTKDDFSVHPLELSGGFQVRLNLARLLVSENNLLLLDEPTNYLDIVSIRWMTQFLRSWKNELIVITHDRDFMDSITTHTMAIHRCRINKLAGGTEKIYEQILCDEELHEKTRLNDEKRRAEIERFINRFRAKATKAKAVQSRIKSLQKKGQIGKMAEIRSLDFEFNPAPFTGKVLLEAKDIGYSFSPDGPPLIENFSIVVGKKDRIGIIGKNGAGKTTLLNILAGGIHPSSGSITLHPQMISAYFGQTNIDRLHPNNTIEEEIMEVHPEHNRGAARSVCGAMMFEGDQALKKISVISGGEKSRVLLGKLLVSPANLLLLDEPTNHLDMESVGALIDALEAYSGAVMIVTHSEMVLHAVATRLIIFDNNSVTAFDGAYEDFLERVGWKDEHQAASSQGRNGKNRENVMTRKDVRRIRAEIITEKSKILGAIQRRIDDVERSIVHLENETEKKTEALLDVSRAGNGLAITELSKSLHEGRLKIDLLFDELISLTDELTSRSKEFEERLNEVMQKT